MVTIDKKGAFHDSAGRYADKQSHHHLPGVGWVTLPGSGLGGFSLNQKFCDACGGAIPAFSDICLCGGVVPENQATPLSTKDIILADYAYALMDDETLLTDEFFASQDFDEPLDFLKTLEGLALTGHHETELDPKTLHATQAHLYVDDIAQVIDDPDEDELLVSVYLHDGKHYLIDGHHRAVAAIVQGKPISAWVTEINKPDLTQVYLENTESVEYQKSLASDIGAAYDENSPNQAAAEAALIEKFGSKEKAICHLGQCIADRAASAEIDEATERWRTRIADLTPEAAGQILDEQLEVAQAQAAEVSEPEQKLREEITELHRGITRMLVGCDDPMAMQYREQYGAGLLTNDELRSGIKELFNEKDAAAFSEKEKLIEAKRKELYALEDERLKSVTDLTIEKTLYERESKRYVPDYLQKQMAVELREQVFEPMAARYVDCLSDIRDMGGVIEVHNKTAAKARTEIARAARLFPTKWIAASNEKSTLPLARITKARAHYTETDYKVPGKKVMAIYNTGEVNLTPEFYDQGGSVYSRGDDGQMKVQYFETRFDYGFYGDDVSPRGRGWERFESKRENGSVFSGWRRPKYSIRKDYSEAEKISDLSVSADYLTDDYLPVALHELTHRFEHSNSAIGRAEKEFKARRTEEHGDGQLRQIPGSPQGEYHREAGFIDPYFGRDYNRGEDYAAHEVLSNGIEALYTGVYGGLIGLDKKYDRTDLEHRNFTLGALAAL